MFADQDLFHRHFTFKYKGMRDKETESLQMLELGVLSKVATNSIAYRPAIFDVVAP